MNTQAHVAELLKKHETFDKELRDETKRSSVDAFKVSELKRKKLLIKDQIAKITGVSYKGP